MRDDAACVGDECLLAVSVDAEPVQRNTVHDLFATLDGFTAGQKVRVQIIAANEAGEAKPSEAVEMVMA